MRAEPTVTPSSTTMKATGQRGSGIQDHAKACRAWFSSLSAEDKASATACEDPKFIRMYLNLTKRMEARVGNGNHSAANGGNGSVSTISSSSKPVNHPRSEAAQASLPLSVSRRHLAKMYDAQATAVQPPTSLPSGHDYASKKQENVPNNCEHTDVARNISVSDTITSQSEGPKRIQNSRSFSGDSLSKIKMSYVDTIKASVSKENMCENPTKQIEFKEADYELPQLSACNEDVPLPPKTTPENERSGKIHETSSVVGSSLFPVDQSKSIASASTLQSKARLAALTTPCGRNGIEVILLDPLWLGNGANRKQQPLFLLANEILQAPFERGFLSAPPKKWCDLAMTDPVVLPTWLISCSEAFWNAKKSSESNTLSMVDDVNIPFHFLLIARIELSIWASYWQSRNHISQQRAWSPPPSPGGTNFKLSKILSRAKKFHQYGNTVGFSQCRQIMSPVTLLGDKSSNQRYISEYDSLDKLILLPIPWVLLHGRDAEQCGVNNVGYAGSSHPVWKCIEEVEGAIADRVWSGVSAEDTVTTNENICKTSSVTCVNISTSNASVSNTAASSGNNGNGNKKKKKKSKKKKKRQQAQQTDQKQAAPPNDNKGNVSSSADASSVMSSKLGKHATNREEATSPPPDHVTNKSISSIVSSSSSSSMSSTSTLPATAIYRPPQKQQVVEEATSLKQKVKEVQNKSLIITTIAAGKTVVVNNSVLSPSNGLPTPLSSTPSSTLKIETSDGGEWDVVGQKSARGKNNNRWGGGNLSGDASIVSERWSHNGGKHSQKNMQHQGDSKTSSGTSSSCHGKQNHHGSGNNKRHAKNKKLVGDIVLNSLLPMVEAEVDRRSLAAGKIQSIRIVPGASKKLGQNVKASNGGIDPSLHQKSVVQVDSSYSGVTCGTVTTTTAYPESATLSTANNTTVPPVMTVSNDICVGGNSTTSSVASSLDNDHHPHSFVSLRDGTDGKISHHGQEDPSRSVGYHLLNVCNRLSCDMATFMGRRGVALATRRRERGRLLQALQSTTAHVWPSNSCHVEMYGSCATQLDLPSSDLDLVICGLSIEKNTQNTSASRIYQLADELERQSWAVHVKPIATATVPVVKLLADPSRISSSVGNNNPQQISQQFMEQGHPHHVHHPHQYVPTWRGADVMNGLIQVDITFEGPEHGGVASTEFAARMVQDAMNESGLPRPEATPAVQVVMVLKELLAQRRLNEPFSGGLSSYGLILMVFAIIRENRALRAQYKTQADLMLAVAQQEEQTRLEQKKMQNLQHQREKQEKLPQMVKTSSWAFIAKLKQQQSQPSVTPISGSLSAPVIETPTAQSQNIANTDDTASFVHKTLSLSNELAMRSIETVSSGVVPSGIVSSTNALSDESKVKYSNKNNEVFLPESNDILEVLCSGEPTSGKLLMHFLLFYGHIFDSTTNAIEVRYPHSPIIPRQMGVVCDPVTGMLVNDQLVVYDPLEGAEKNNVARSCFAWSSIRWVFAQSYTTLTNTLDRRGSRGEEISDNNSPLMELLMSY